MFIYVYYNEFSELFYKNYITHTMALFFCIKFLINAINKFKRAWKNKNIWAC